MEGALFLAIFLVMLLPLAFRWKWGWLIIAILSMIFVVPIFFDVDGILMWGSSVFGLLNSMIAAVSFVYWRDNTGRVSATYYQVLDAPLSENVHRDYSLAAWLIVGPMICVLGGLYFCFYDDSMLPWEAEYKTFMSLVVLWSFLLWLIGLYFLGIKQRFSWLIVTVLAVCTITNIQILSMHYWGTVRDTHTFFINKVLPSIITAALIVMTSVYGYYTWGNSVLKHNKKNE